MDERIRHLARLAGEGDLSAAKLLVINLERVGAADTFDTLIEEARKVLDIYGDAHNTEDINDLLLSSDAGVEFASNFLRFLQHYKIVENPWF